MKDAFAFSFITAVLYYTIFDLSSPFCNFFEIFLHFLILHKTRCRIRGVLWGLTGALDSENTADILKYLRKINKENGVTVIIVTHDPDVASTCDRTIMIEDGRIVR